MTTQTGPRAATDQEKRAQTGRSAQLQLHAQYLRDLSFESPDPRRNIVRARAAGPRAEMRFDLQVTKIEAHLWELVLRLRLAALDAETRKPEPAPDAARAEEAEENAQPLFVVELEYGALMTPPHAPAGSGTAQNPDSDEIDRRVLLTDGAQLLFPYVRKILSDVTQEGGFQPVLLSPIDFHGLYRARKQAEASAAQAARARDMETPSKPNGADTA